MQNIWKLKEPDIKLKNLLAEGLKESSLFAQLLINRGVSGLDEAKAFLDSDLKYLHDPFLMKGMESSVKRISEGLKKREVFFIATDFDVDGLTSCAVLELELKRRGANVVHYVPHRVKDGYGLNLNTVSLAKEAGAGIFIALDCGITAQKEVKELNDRGIDCIILDHHTPPESLPDALAIINPKQKDCSYPFKEMASVGLVFKLIQALETEDLFGYLDLVALGTVADVVPLTGENRIFVKHGLEVLNSTKRHGLISLIEAAGIKKDKKISTRSISFMLAPRINASGRIDSADVSLDLLLADDCRQASVLAKYLNEHNRLRQRIEEKILSEALDIIDRDVNFKEDYVIVLGKEDWHPGVLGIVASKIVDRFYRPAIIMSFENGLGRGSARSVHNFHIYEALAQCSGYLLEYGGHKYAAGLTIDKANLEDFRKSLNSIARENFQSEVLSAVLDADAQIPFSLINDKLLTSIDRLGPFGEGNRRPVFVSCDLCVKSKPSLVGRNSLKFWVSDGDVTFEAIGFGMGDYLGMVSGAQRIDMAYSLGWDDWSPHNSIQLEIEDIKLSDF